MNIVNIVIIIFILLTLAVIIFVIMKGLRSVDENIIKELESDKIIKRRGIFQKIKEIIVLFFEKVVKKINQITQKLYSWIVRVKKREKNEVIKAKEELIINDNNSGEKRKKIIINKTKSDKVLNISSNDVNDESIGSSNKEQTLDKYFSDFHRKNKDIGDNDNSMKVLDESEKKSKKSGFVKNIFKKRKKTKQVFDIQSDNSEEWTLGGADNKKERDADNLKKKKPQLKKADITPVGSKFKGGISVDSGIKKPSEDDMLGVDRKILEKKILQKIDKNPKNIDNYKELGNLYIKMEKLDDALEVFTYILSVAPRDVEALNKQNKIKLLKKVQK